MMSMMIMICMVSMMMNRKMMMTVVMMSGMPSRPRRDGLRYRRIPGGVRKPRHDTRRNPGRGWASFRYGILYQAES